MIGKKLKRSNRERSADVGSNTNKDVYLKMVMFIV